MNNSSDLVRPYTRRSYRVSGFRKQLGGHAALLVLPLILGSVAGCGGSSADSPAVAVSAAADTAPRFVVCGIDRSGSYDFVAVGRELCAQAIAKAERPGDVIIVRWISDASYRNHEFVVRVTIPSRQLPDCSGNPFNARCRREYTRQDALWRSASHRTRKAAVERLLEIEPRSAPRTDIYGFLQAAADLMAGAAAGMQRHLYIATDLKDNVGNSVKPALAGVHVRVVALETDSDPAAALRLRNHWEARLREFGAVEVLFQPAEVVP